MFTFIHIKLDESHLFSYISYNIYNFNFTLHIPDQYINMNSILFTINEGLKKNPRIFQKKTHTHMSISIIE